MDENKITKPHKLLNQDIEGVNRNYLELLDNYENITLMELKTTNSFFSFYTKAPGQNDRVLLRPKSSKYSRRGGILSRPYEHGIKNKS